VDRLGLVESLVEQVDRIGVILVDGMGWHLLPEVATHAPLLASVLAGGTGRTDAAYRGAEFRPAPPSDDYAGILADELRAAPGLVYGYIADLDTAAHIFGIGTPQWHEAAVRVATLQH